MSGSHRPDNPYEASQETDPARAHPTSPRRIHPAMIILLMLASIVVGGLTFFCTCLGVITSDFGSNDAALWLCILAALFATVGFFWFTVHMLRKPRRQQRSKVAVRAEVIDLDDS